MSMESIKFCGNTDLGKVRTNNEDAYIVQNIWDENHVLAVAIDGVGGYEGGEVASGMAKKYIVEYLENYSNGERLELLKQAVVYANNNIFSARRELHQYSSMSCVLTAIIVDVTGRCVHMAHVGDTRLYQYSDDELVKLSHDHSLVGYREEIGELTEDEAMHHPQRNVIGRDVGSTYLDGNVGEYVETATFPLLPKSDLLLCSDGLCDMLKSVEIKSVLETKCTVEEKVGQLIAAANEAGGKDNVTVVLVEVDMDVEADEPLVEDDNGHEEENMPDNISEDMAVDKGTSLNWKNSKNNWRLWALAAAVAFAMFVVGFMSGMFTERNGVLHKPSDNIQETMNCCRDSVILGLQQDTMILHHRIAEKDSLINVLKVALANN
ncbi:MAG: protein phosphatase 2C domain-containing protein [Clostridium sp.]|nr:protein phosphatase 2C domain-containing protein [Bacteroides sp.]MCM1199005.1 protein phosphatase 2C domain-containing protein [Clostridium sp.]